MPSFEAVQPALMRRKRYLVIAFILFIGSAGGFLYFFYQQPGPVISPKSVAVMPFDSVGSGGQDDYLSDGLTTEVIFQLAKISDLRVISRSSILRYKAAHSSASKQVLPDIAQSWGLQRFLRAVFNAWRTASKLQLSSTMREHIGGSGRNLSTTRSKICLLSRAMSLSTSPLRFR